MNGLPSEIWTLVLSHLDALEDRQVVVALCLVSKVLLHLARPVLYSVLSGHDFHKAALMNTLVASNNAQALARLVHEVVFEICLRLEQLEQRDEKETGPDWSWSYGECVEAQLQVERQWQQSAAAIQKCSSVVKAAFKLSIIDGGRDIGDGDSPAHHIPLPTLAQFLSLPFVNSLRELFIWLPFDNDYDHSLFGEFALACRSLHKLKLRYVSLPGFLKPILDALALHGQVPIALDTVECVEDFPAYGYDEPPQWFHEMLPDFRRLPSLCNIIYTDSCLHYAFLWHTLRETPMLHVQQMTIHEQEPQYGGHHPTRSDGQSYPHETRNAMQLLASYFPHLRKLTMTTLQAGRYDVTTAVFPLLELLSIVEGTPAEHDDSGFPEAMLSLPTQLLHRNFAPALRVAKFRMCQPKDDEEAVAGIEEATGLLGECAQMIGEHLELVEVIYGAQRRVFRRTERGFVVAGM